MVTELSSPGLPLRPYQQEAIDAVFGADAAGISRPLVALPTGTGKTVIFSHFIAQREGRALVLAHRDELICQAADKLLTVNPNFELGIVKAKENETEAPLVVASVQTLARKKRLEQMRGDFNTVIVDEGHHATAETYHRVLEHVGSFNEGGPLTLGVTATPERGDKVGLIHVWQGIVYQKSLLEMILAGYLCDLRAIRVGLQLDLGCIRTRHGDYVDGDLGRAMLEADAPQHVVTAYQEHAPGRKALVFTPLVKVAHEMAAAFQQEGVAAEALDGTTPEEERRDILKRLHTGETMVVANCAVLTEGFDEPSVDCIVVARPTKSRPFYMQMLGRGTRIHPGKADCLIIDCVGVSERHALVTANSLLGKDLTATGASVREIVEEEERAAARAPLLMDGELVASPVNLFASRPLHWAKTRQGAWVLSLGDRGMLRLSTEDGNRWTVHHVLNGTPHQLWGGLPLGYAQGVAEDFARKQGSMILLDPHASWRQDPATDKQVRALRKFGLPFGPNITKGQAADLLTLVFGDK
jgi:ATP-dependent helicase IRC3